jgi:cytidylate kinase
MLKNGTIAIDGPSASGKSSLAKAVAKELGWIHADTGSLYRAVAYLLEQSRMENAGEDSICRYLKNRQIVFAIREGSTRVLRGENTGRTGSRISQIPCVRDYLLDVQRNFGQKGGVVMDGRDIGTVILPQATLKVFLYADPLVRAFRRHRELTQKGIQADLEAVRKDLEERDRLDRSRQLAPLVQAPDAVVLDNSHLSIEDSVQWILQKLPD